MRLRLFFALFALAAAVAARADDGILYFFGAPELMHGESSIRMVREFVSAKVYKHHADVYCRFVLRNNGLPVDARIGFPDGSDHSYEDDQTPTPDLKHFRSRVDGKLVATRIEISPTSSEEIPLYHVKTVHFGSRQTRIVEDWYRGELSGGGTHTLVPMDKAGQEDLYVSQFEYKLQTGGSWKGNISKATLQVEFMEKNLRHIRTIPEAQFGMPEESTKLNRLPLNRVIWSGFAKPKASGNRMIFERKNFKPSVGDDVQLTFDWRRYGDFK